ncbi:hypothetical protein KR032_005198 [Drosophila birchii]|nr:hypothetical protein KR032_005198 [Drosophila birchii]
MNSRNRQFWTEFLLLYRSLPAVWRVHSPDYCCRELKSAGYEQLVRKLREVEPDANRFHVVRKINSFRTNFRRDLRHRDHCLATGEPFTSNLWYFHLLSFLEGQDKGARNQKAPEATQSPPKCDNFVEIKEEFLLSPAPSPSPAKSVSLENNYAFSTLPEIPEEKSSSIQRLSETEALTQAWGHQFEELSQRQRTIARKFISDILYYGCMEQLDPSHVDQMHQIIKKKDIESERTSFKDKR